MVDEVQLVEDAVVALASISDAYRGEPIASLAAQLSHQIYPRMAFDAAPDFKELERRYEQTPKDFAEEARKVASRRGPTYQTPVFKCIGDYEKCKKASNKRLCVVLLAICVGKHIIPFIPKGHDGQ